MAKHTRTPKASATTSKVYNEYKTPHSITRRGTKARIGHLHGIILIAVVLIINAPTINYNYTFDDPFFTRSNVLVMKGIASIPEFFTHAAYYGVYKNQDAIYRPLMLTSFALEKQIVGYFNPGISHLINLFLFCLQIFALFTLLKKIFNNYSIYIPFFIVLLFELHPIHTEVIASVKSRDEIMALLFTCMCMLQTIKYIDTNKITCLVWSGFWFF